MAQAEQYSHKIIDNTALPYITFNSPIDQTPQFEGGRNVMISGRQYCAMRPGFADYLEPTPTTFNHLQRFFSWARWDGTYFVMAVDLQASGKSAVYKFQVGTDASFVKIHEEPTATGVPYSFTTANNYLFSSNGNDTFKWGPATGVQNWGIVAPAAPGVALVAGALTYNVGGYFYVITYVNSTSGHESSPSPLSACASPINQNIRVSWAASSDPQVDKVNIYRTPDGGAQNPTAMGFVAQVPVGSSPYTDSKPDALLSSVQFAPDFYQNDPPPAMKSIVSYVGRIWGIVGSRVWYSGQEEIGNGVPQETFAGASVNSPAGNFYAYETLLTALAPLTDGVAVFNANRIQKIEGDSKDNFRRYTLLAKRGTVTDYTVRVVGNSVLWFDRSKQLWLSDEGEAGKDIRPDLARANLTTAQACIHIAGEQHWICLLDPDNSLLYVYDLDLNMWNVPWGVHGTCIESIDIAPGVSRLAIGLNGTQVCLENPNLYLDGSVQYDAFAVTNPLSLAPENNPDMAAALHHVAVESNQYQPVSVSVKVDEDSTALAASLLASPITYGGFNVLTTVTDPPRRGNGQYLVMKHYMGSPDSAAPSCQRMAVRLDWKNPQPALWTFYSLDLAMTPTGS